MRQSQFLMCLLVISSIIMMVPSSPKVLAAVISCVGSFPFCEGTNDDDVMKGDNEGNTILGLDGNDILNGGLGDEDAILGGDGDDQIFGGPGGDDELIGDDGNDKISGGPGDDVVMGGGEGDDIMNGGPGDDTISHWIWPGDIDKTLSDGGQDKIDCGPGDDEVWINVNTDHDTVKNCETVHTESD